MFMLFMPESHAVFRQTGCDRPTICRQKAAVAPLCAPAFGPPMAAVCGPIKLPMEARRRAAEFCQLGGTAAPRPPLFGPCLLWPRSQRPIPVTAELLYK